MNTCSFKATEFGAWQKKLLNTRIHIMIENLAVPCITLIMDCSVPIHSQCYLYAKILV